jgi:hypothetical protein
MLTGRWRGGSDRQPDPGTCLATLRAWAWSGTSSHPLSGIGNWADDIDTEPTRLDEVSEEALDHVAPAVGPPDVDTGRITRRFIHRSLREYLVAEYVAGLTADNAAEVLLAHLWYDPDWEYAAPAALAIHPEREKLLRDLTRRAASPGPAPESMSAIDGGGEFRKLLARAACESSEADWSPEAARTISAARERLAKSGRVDDLGAATAWGTSSGRARDALLSLLASEPGSRSHYGTAGVLVENVVKLAYTAEDKRQTRAALLELVTRQEPYPGELSRVLPDKLAETQKAALIRGAVQLAGTAEDKRQTRDMLLGLVPGEIASTAEAAALSAVGQLARTPEDKRQARGMLLRLLPGEIASTTPAAVVAWLASQIQELGPVPEDARHAARGTLLAVALGEYSVGLLVDGVVPLARTAKDKEQTRDTLLSLLARQTDFKAAEKLLGGVMRLDPTVPDKRRARDILLGTLAGETSTYAAQWQVGAVNMLGASSAAKRQARAALLRLLASETTAYIAPDLACELAGLDPAERDKRDARAVLLRLLDPEDDRWVVTKLLDAVTRLDPTADDKRQLQRAMVAKLASEDDGWDAGELAGQVLKLGPTAADKRQVRDALLVGLARQTEAHKADALLDAAVELDPTLKGKEHVRKALLKVLAAHADGWMGASLVSQMAKLGPTAEEERRVRAAVLRLLASETDSGWTASALIDTLVTLGPTGDSERQARETVLRLLVSGRGISQAGRLISAMAKLDPTADDLITWPAWEARPDADLLAAARRNSALAAWLAALSPLAPLSD